MHLLSRWQTDRKCGCWPNWRICPSCSVLLCEHCAADMGLGVYVSGTSQAMGLPLAHGSNVVPSGLLLSSLTRLTGSLTAGIWARFSARHMMSFSWLWRCCLGALLWYYYFMCLCVCNCVVEGLHSLSLTRRRKQYQRSKITMMRRWTDVNCTWVSLTAAPSQHQTNQHHRSLSVCIPLHSYTLSTVQTKWTSK